MLDKISNKVFGRNKGNMPDFRVSETIGGFIKKPLDVFAPAKASKSSNQQTDPEFDKNIGSTYEEESWKKDTVNPIKEGDASPSIDEQVEKFSNEGGSSSKSGSSSESGGSSSKSQDDAEAEKRKFIKQGIISGWDDFDTTIENTKGYVNKLGNNDIDTVSRKYREATDDRLKRSQESIAGNRELIDKNQRKDLTGLAGQTKREMENTNNMLGVLGASRGSASWLANKAIGEQAGKQRANILTGYGDQVSGQNQELSKQQEVYKLQKDYIEDWDKTKKREVMDELNDALNELEQMKKSKGGWREADLRAEESTKFQEAKAKLDEITNRTETFRALILQAADQMGMNADQLAAENVDITRPAELDTPEFNADVDFANEEQGEDYFNPNKTGERKVLTDKNGNPVKDAFGNVMYEDEVLV